MSHRLTLSLRSIASRPSIAVVNSPAASMAYRALSTSPILRLATPQSSHQTGPTVPGYPPAAPIVPKRQEVAVDYSKGPSALDKAASLFFFTEILRGTFTLFTPLCSDYSARVGQFKLTRIPLRRLAIQE